MKGEENKMNDKKEEKRMTKRKNNKESKEGKDREEIKPLDIQKFIRQNIYKIWKGVLL